MLDVITANKIGNILQDKMGNLEQIENPYLNTCITMGSFVNVAIRNTDYWVIPIILFKRGYGLTKSMYYKGFVLGFVYNRTVYEVGKYSRTSSKQFTHIYNAYFGDKYDRVYIEKTL
mgnify:CR=1 FL=1|jgi:hypothetical protein